MQLKITDVTGPTDVHKIYKLTDDMGLVNVSLVKYDNETRYTYHNVVTGTDNYFTSIDNFLEAVIRVMGTAKK